MGVQSWCALHWDGVGNTRKGELWGPARRRGRAGLGCRLGSDPSDLALTPERFGSSLPCLWTGHSFGVHCCGFWFGFPSQSF